MDAFERELMRRSPLAACVLEACDFVFDEAWLGSLWQTHRGRCYEDVLSFEAFLRLMRDALLRHGGSAHQLFLRLERAGSEPVDESNFYRKLARTPAPLSRALLREGTRRLAELMPGPAATLPACFDGFAVVIGDGKKIRNAAKRLKPTRGYGGKLIGAKALVALDARSGLAIAMSDSLDGLANDVPLAPALMEQVRGVIDGPVLSVWDRQFDDARTFGHLSHRVGDAYLVRMKQTHVFTPEDAVETADARGRRVRDQVGLLGRGKHRLRVRRVTLQRAGEGEEEVVLLSNLLERGRYPAADLLELYRRRWGIEQAFQQVTQTFSLEHLIGSSPRAVLLQFAFCLLLYNLMQVVKAYVAEDGKVSAGVVSLFYLFADVKQELTAWAYHGGGHRPRVRRDTWAMRGRMRELLRGSWDPIAYTKASDKKPRRKPPPLKRLHGGHSSVQRLMDGKARVVEG